ncbi:hypothetical protein DSM112329_00732 [Paraconexibacter sp. AEG42_29]|uniref:MBL fold metallo-hydrolase n=1 Tax=Paraconexibacter sp. AEG42_29 TaxID=2997339 RepID=A0AAU7AQH7_9ACTN
MAALRFAAPSDVTRSWTHPSPPWMQRAGHAVLAGGGVWLVDPPDGDGLDAGIAELDAPVRGVLQLLDRHPRDCAALAERLSVPLHVVPLGSGHGLPFEVVPMWHLPVWKEDALWIAESGTLIVPEALVGAPDFAAPGERVGVHPMRRLLPPSVLKRFAGDVEHLLLGHGDALHGDAARAAVRDALGGSRRRLPRLLAAQLTRAARGRFRG